MQPPPTASCRNCYEATLFARTKSAGFFSLVALSLLLAGGYPFQRSRQNPAAQKMRESGFSQHLLESTLIRMTNEERSSRGLPVCSLFVRLRTAARRHSSEMASRQYFSHTSPSARNRNLSNRVENTGVVLEGIVIGENIGVDYFLRIANVPFYRRKAGEKTLYVEAETGNLIENQTYAEFSRSMVDGWMASPGHRKNILNREYRWIGIGAVPGTYQGFPAVYVTQVFMGPIE